MSAAVIQQSIEALYQEAEAVVHQDQPMLTIIQSFPPTVDASHLSIVADSSANMITKGTATTDQIAVWRRIEDLLDEAESLSAATTPDSTEADNLDGAADYSAENLPADMQDAVAPVTAPLEDDTSIAAQSTVEATTADQDINQTIGSEAQMLAIPTEPPAPDQLDGADAMAEADIAALLNEAKADRQTVATPSSDANVVTAFDTDDDIDSVMADIAAAVGGVAPQPTPSGSSTQVKPIDPETVPAVPAHVTAQTEPVQAPTTTQLAEPHAEPQAAPTEALATFISDTVRSVLAEELPGMVKQAVTDALRTAAPAAKTTTAATQKPVKNSAKKLAKKPATQKTAKKVPAKTAPAKKAAAKKVTGKKTGSKKTGSKKTTAKKAVATKATGKQ